MRIRGLAVRTPPTNNTTHPQQNKLWGERTRICASADYFQTASTAPEKTDARSKWTCEKWSTKSSAASHYTETRNSQNTCRVWRTETRVTHPSSHTLSPGRTLLIIRTMVLILQSIIVRPSWSWSRRGFLRAYRVVGKTGRERGFEESGRMRIGKWRCIYDMPGSKRSKTGCINMLFHLHFMSSRKCTKYRTSRDDLHTRAPGLQGRYYAGGASRF